MKLTLVIPVYNEVYLISSVWEKLKTAPIRACQGIDQVEMVVVDDGSRDGTTALLHKLVAQPFKFVGGMTAEVKFFPLERNRGKGHAVRYGIERSTGDIVLIQDADLEYSPDDYPKLFQPIVEGDADAVFGSRFVGTPRRVLYFWHSLVNKFLTTFSNMVNDVNLTDMETCYKAMRGGLARSLRLTSDRFGIEPELTSRLARSKARIYEVPISYRGRTYEEGKKIGVKDGIAALWHIFRFAFLDSEPFQPGLMQTLTALDSAASVIYAPLLHRAIRSTGAGHPLRILEVGAGIGSLTRVLLNYGNVTATDLSEEYVRTLRSRFGTMDHFRAFTWDAAQPPPADMGRFDLIVSFNVLEHIEDDDRALRNWRDLLNPSGSLILLVPNSQRLYSPIDKALGHFRRYSSAALQQKLDASGLRPVTTYFGNAIGIVGWYLMGVLLRRADLPAAQLRLYTGIKRLFGWAERRIERFTGLSIIVVAKVN